MATLGKPFGRKVGGTLNIGVGILSVYYLMDSILYWVRFYSDPEAPEVGIDSVSAAIQHWLSFHMREGLSYFLEQYYPEIVALAAVALTFYGGISALKGKKWSLALVGSVAAVIVTFIHSAYYLIEPHRLLSEIGVLVGIAALILTLITRKSFLRHPNPEDRIPTRNR